ncbi:hypothetical protein P280DRAFT_470899 [Massarina eburnea CBS 473.64]|uniref:Uncharacterized protein n=1 Tax=Massarina eburnea CBS 473.64 TaxID=1395130 RepID=A0A6A6RY43_9PLEO|nr:hypothetical protein P280DRAFT_470899 [Massarina eburnea CBS 473.64]
MVLGGFWLVGWLGWVGLVAGWRGLDWDGERGLLRVRWWMLLVCGISSSAMIPRKRN